MKKNSKPALPAPPVDSRTALYALLMRIADAIVRQQLVLHQRADTDRQVAGDDKIDQEVGPPNAK